jgi:hypothetical protein
MNSLACAGPYGDWYAKTDYTNLGKYLNNNTITLGSWLGCYGSPSTLTHRWIVQLIPCVYTTCETWIKSGQLDIRLSDVVNDAISGFGLNPSSTTVGVIGFGSEYGAFYQWWTPASSVVETVNLNSWSISYGGSIYWMVNSL